MPAFETQDGMPVWQELLTTDVSKASYFYSQVFGWEVGEIAHKDGLPVAGFLESDHNAWVTYFAADVDETEVVADPSGGLFGLRGGERFVAAGEPGVPVWYELAAPDEATIDYYGERFNWEIRKEDGYFLALVDGAPFLGMRVTGQPRSAWQTYFGVEDLRQAVHAVEQFGGKVLEGPVESPFGPLALVHDAVGAELLLVEVAKPVFEEVSEADNILQL